MYYAHWDSIAVTNVEKLAAQTKAYPFKIEDSDKLDNVADDFAEDSWILFKRALNDINLKASDEDKAGKALEKLLAAEAIPNVSTAVYRVYDPFAVNTDRHVCSDKKECLELVGQGYVWDNDGELVYMFDAVRQ